MSGVALYDVRGGVATVTLNRPDRRNGLTVEMLELLPGLFREAARDPDVRCVVLTGAGDRAFSAGFDLAPPADDAAAPAEATLEASIDDIRRRQEVSYLLHTMAKPTIAAINGSAAGASLAMALACDLRVAVEGAILRTAFAGIGFSGDFGGSYFLTHIVGSARARELMLLDERVTAERALEVGLVARIFPRPTFREEVTSFAGRLAAGPPLSYRYMKRNLNLAEAGAHLGEILDLEAEAMVRTGRSEDLMEGVRAFLQKDEPSFQGR